MENEYLLIVGGSYDQEPLIRKAKKLGYKTVVVDINEDLPGYKIADVKRKISTRDIEAGIKIAREFNVKGVLTNASESAICTISAICDTLSLPGLPPKVAEKVTDKELMKIAFEKHNLPTPKFYLVKSKSESFKAIKKLGYPCIIKPVDGAGSKGVLRIDKFEEIENAFNYSYSFSNKKRCLIEEFVEGVEMSADALSYQGETGILAISDKKKEPNTKNNVAMHIVYPPRFSKEEILNPKKLIMAVVKGFGIENGPSHTEIIRRGKNDFVVLEIGARGGGFWTFSKVVSQISGIDTLKQLINFSVGKPIEIKPKRQNAAVLKFLSGKPGRIVKLGDSKKANKTKGVISAGYFVKEGAIVKKVERDGDRVAYIIVCANNRREAQNIANEVSTILKVKTEPL